MSEYSESTTEFKDADILIAALAAVGYDKIENCIGKPQPLVGFQGDYRTLDGEGHTKDPNKALKADIIVRRKFVGGTSNDIGFVKGADGKFRAIISAYDSHRHGAPWLSKVKGEYAEANVVRNMKRAGVRITGRTTRQNEQGQEEAVYSYVRN